MRIEHAEAAVAQMMEASRQHDPIRHAELMIWLSDLNSDSESETESMEEEQD
jgi:hypothetical protein